MEGLVVAYIEMVVRMDTRVQLVFTRHATKASELLTMEGVCGKQIRSPRKGTVKSLEESLKFECHVLYTKYHYACQVSLTC
jgi:hypothetical protein